MLGDSDIVNLAKGLSDRTVAVGKISFGSSETNLLKANIHWAQDFMMIIQTPSLISISNAAEFRAAVEAAWQRDRIRKHVLEESTSFSKAYNPGKLKRHKYWITWSRALKNYLSTILGQYKVLLIYVIRECAVAIESQPNYEFEQFSVNFVPLNGLNCNIDAMEVNQLINGFVKG